MPDPGEFTKVAAIPAIAPPNAPRVTRRWVMPIKSASKAVIIIAVARGGNWDAWPLLRFAGGRDSPFVTFTMAFIPASMPPE
jgi:hypothetical protein